MIRYFADANYYLALINQDDDLNSKVLDVTRKLRGAEIITTAWILTELADAFCQPPNREKTVRTIERLRKNPSVTVVAPSWELFEKGLDLFLRRGDKDWPLTDCISFVTMEQFGLQEALAEDHHFEQAGFRALMR